MRTWETGTSEVAPGVHAYVQATGGMCIANAGIISGDRETTVIDALFSPAMTRALLEAVPGVAAALITRLINTHHHVDHTLGNAMFPADAEIVAHARAKAEMQRAGLSALDIIQRIAPHFRGELDGVRERLPDVTFNAHALELRVGSRVVRLLHFGVGHTAGDVLVHLPEERVLFAGDLAFFYVTPLAHEGHIGRWIAVVERVLAGIDADIIVPGHGPVAGKDELREMLGYLTLIHNGAKAAFQADVPAAEAASAIDLGPYAQWGEANRIAVNVPRLYQEFRGELEALVAAEGA
jgi:glyoxylase-like metal-dependent hydrolase (beta-lactamase superfamily II)